MARLLGGTGQITTVTPVVLPGFLNVAVSVMLAGADEVLELTAEPIDASLGVASQSATMTLKAAPELAVYLEFQQVPEEALRQAAVGQSVPVTLHADSVR